MMRSAAVFALLVSFAGARADEKDKKDTKTPKELEGTYKLVHAERDGKPAEKAIIDPVTVTIKGDEFVMSMAGSDDKKVAKIKVTADAKPATIDISPQDGLEKGKTFPGIYKLEKGELTLAFNETGDRPKEFKSENGVILLRLKRAEK